MQILTSKIGEEPKILTTLLDSLHIFPLPYNRPVFRILMESKHLCLDIKSISYNNLINNVTPEQ